MMFPRPKIRLYQERTFGEKFSATFDFIKENWRLWLKGSCYLLLPLSLVQSFTLNSFMGTWFSTIEGGPSDNEVVNFLVSYGGYILFTIIGIVLMTSFLYAMMQEYQQNARRLENVTLTDLKPLMIKNVKRSLLVSLVLGIVTVVVFGILSFAAVSYESVWLFLLVVVGLMVSFVPMSLVLPTYIFETDNGLFYSISRGFGLGWSTWGGTALLMLVMSFIVNFIQSIFATPWLVATIVKAVLVSESGDSSLVQSGIYSFMMYLLGVVQLFGTYVASTLTVVSLAYQYGHAAEREDGMSVNDDIANFESMANNELGGFESTTNNDIANFESL